MRHRRVCFGSIFDLIWLASLGFGPCWIGGIGVDLARFGIEARRLVPRLVASDLASPIVRSPASPLGENDDERPDEERPAAPRSAAAETEDENASAILDLAHHLSVDLDALAGPDDASAVVEAARLLQTLESSSAVARARAERLVVLLLDPARLAHTTDPADVDRFRSAARAARRLVETLALHPRDESAVLDVAETALVPLLGRGPRELRDAVVGALIRAIRERSKDLEDRTTRLVGILGDEIEHNEPPAAARLEDLSAVLWELDAKQFLDRAVAGLVLNETTHPRFAPSYARELRARIFLDLDSAAEWSEWWSRHRDASIAQILVETQRALAIDAAERWSQSVRRLRETGAARRVLDEIAEAFSKGATRELREAGVRALGDYAEWVRTASLGAVENPEQQRANFSREACELLVGVIEGRTDRVRDPSVERLAFAALLKFQPFLERAPAELLERAQALCVERLEAQISTVATPESRASIIEIAHLAGGLRVAAARPALETLALTPEAARDPEVLLAVVPALGRLVKGGLEASTAEIFFGLFEDAGQLGEAVAAKLRSRAVAALNAKPASPAVADRVREFYEQVLGSARYRDLRIHAVIGLGTLAQGQDRVAFETLVRALASAKLEGTEEIAALDAIAYVGGRAAIESLVPLFAPATPGMSEQRRAVVEHVRRKLVGLLHSASPVDIAFLLERLEALAREIGDLSPLHFSREISDIPEVARLRWGAAPSETSPGPTPAERARLSLDALRAAIVVAPETSAALVASLRTAFEAATETLADGAREELALLARLDERAREVSARLDAGREVDPSALNASLEALLAAARVVPRWSLPTPKSSDELLPASPRASSTESPAAEPADAEPAETGSPASESSGGEVASAGRAANESPPYGVFAAFAVIEREIGRRRASSPEEGVRSTLVIDLWEALLAREERKEAFAPPGALRAHRARLTALRGASAGSAIAPPSSAAPNPPSGSRSQDAESAPVPERSEAVEDEASLRGR